MRKGAIVEGTIEKVSFPNKGLLHIGEGSSCMEVVVKNTLPGQQVRARITKKHSGHAEAVLLEVLCPSALETVPSCPQFGICGGCQYLSLPEETERQIKEEQVRTLLRSADPDADSWYRGILESPVTEGYRNKMELTFGDEHKDGPLTLGMHRRGSFYDVVNADQCRIVDGDYRTIIRTVREYWADTGAAYYHRMRHEGYLRHLLIRKGMKTGEILIDLVTTGQAADSAWERECLDGFVRTLLPLELEGRICGILHTRNDSIADVVEDQGTEILYGKNSFEEELLGIRFTVTPFSFFQTNSAGAELLYQTARSFVEFSGTMRESDSGRKPVIFDLYCGTGTISLLMSPSASKVIGVEIVEEAVRAARENAARNGVSNCEFLAGDVLKVLDTIGEQPDLIILDPPRDGIHPKALPKILQYGVSDILYISCKPTSLARDLPVMMEAGYRPVRGISVNQFPKTNAVETVVLMSNEKSKPDSCVDLTLDMKAYHRIVGDGEKP